MNILQASNNVKLPPRLQAVADLVMPVDVFADIGTDHAYVPVYLVKNKVCARGYACDIKPGPLQKAQANIERYHCTRSIVTMLADGLSGLPLNDIDAIIIAGMGGEMVIKILENAKDKIKSGQRLVLQPMTDIPMVRQYLYEGEFDIVTERLAMDKGKLYHVLKAVKTSARIQYTLSSVIVGKCEKSELYGHYLQNSIHKYQKRIDGLKKAITADNTEIERLCEEQKMFLSEVELSGYSK